MKIVVSQELLNALGGALVILVVILVCGGLVLFVARILRPRSVSAPTPTPRAAPREPVAERPRTIAPREPVAMSYGGRKVVGALVLALASGASTLVVFGSPGLAACVAAALVVVSFNAYDKLDTSLDNVLGLAAVTLFAGVLVVVLRVIAPFIATATGASSSDASAWIWAVSVPAAIGAHMLIVNDDRRVRSDLRMPREKRPLLLVGVVVATVGLTVALIGWIGGTLR